MNTNQITHKHYLYHVTEKENVDNILKEGLKKNDWAVYLSENPFSWWKPGLIILKVRVTGLKNKMTRVDDSLDEFLVWEDINPERISRHVMTQKQLKDAEINYYSLLPGRKKYIKTLPKNKQLAIWLHEKFCDFDHTEQCSFYNEIYNSQDDWTAPSHNNYLLFANQLLRVKNDINFIIKVLTPMKIKKSKKKKKN